MSPKEQSYIFWYRHLNTLERLAVNAYLQTGDDRLIVWLRPSSKALQHFDYGVTQQVQAVS